jgi:hypothetical protein
MRYLLLICFDESVAADPPSDLSDQSRAWVDELEARGIRTTGGPLQPLSAAASVRARAGRVVVGNGPFARTSEEIAGFDVIECADLDEAVAVAAQHPVAKVGTIEVRPIQEE